MLRRASSFNMTWMTRHRADRMRKVVIHVTNAISEYERVMSIASWSRRTDHFSATSTTSCQEVSLLPDDLIASKSMLYDASPGGGGLEPHVAGEGCVNARRRN